jgi:predicted DsbA family dithiol-disulfide isomerase
MAADVVITEYTDPACPWAFSAEPFRRRLTWLYGEQLEWDVRMVGLSDDPAAMEAKGFSTKMLSEAYKKISREHRMPIDTAPRERLSASIPACRAVVAAKLHAPDHMRRLLRRLRVRTFSGELLDAPETIDGAARDAGIDPTQLREWMEGADVQEALDRDMAAAREPSRAARVLDAKLADWSGGRRYTCPSYEIERRSDGTTFAAPGFQPFAVYDTALANLLPDLERRPDPDSVEEVLAWTGTPLATIEVATVCAIPFEDAREQLARVALEQPVGFDGFWTLCGNAGANANAAA